MPSAGAGCPTCRASRAEPWATASAPVAAADLAADRRRAAARGGAPTGDLPPGRILAGRYRIVRLVGRGGMGEVYQADDLVLAQTVALKGLPRERRDDRLRRELLLNEVRLARQVSHPSVCRVDDVVEAEGHLFLSMEYVEGESLATLLRRIGRLPPERALEIALELCQGLEAAHARGILHRDLKPANLLVDADGRLRIVDFGLAWIFGRPSAKNAENAASSSPSRAGTPAYMAPELREPGGTATVRSDLYALGLVLYEIFTGRRALREPTPFDPPSQVIEGLDTEIDRTILACLAADPAHRPASAAAVATVFERLASAPWRPEAGGRVPSRPSWRLERRLGEGGFGEVWLAGHRASGARRVLKFCHEAGRIEALQREITLSRLLSEELGERPDIHRILDWSFDDPPWFIESEHLACGNLRDWAESVGGLGAIPLTARLEIVAQVATALAAAHSIGVLHKDVKPSNVLVRRGDLENPAVQLADFGVGAILETERLRRAGITALGFGDGEAVAAYGGTPLYMAPELLEGRPSTVQADVYALGVLLFQMVVADFNRALAPGWRREIDDELLAEDIAGAVDGSAARRLGDASVLAQSVRSLDERRRERAASRRAAADATAARRALVRSRRRRRLGLGLLLAALTVTALALFQAELTRRQAQRARDIARVAVAAEWLPRDPTRAALVLLEVDDARVTPFVDAKMREALRSALARLEMRHREFISAVAWSPDGRRLLTASWDATARIWDGTDGRLVGLLEGHGAEVMAAVWSPDGRRVATASRDDTARIWELAPAGVVQVLRGHEDNVQSVTWSPDGRRLATTSRDGTARIWDARTGASLAVLHGHDALVTRAAWSPDGRWLVTAGYDGKALLWDLVEPLTGLEPQLLARDQGRIWQVAWRPAGDGPAAGVGIASDRGAWLVEIGPSAEVGEARALSAGSGPLRALAWNPQGTLLAVGPSGGDVHIWPGRPQPEEAPRVLSGHEETIWGAFWSPEGERLLTTSPDRTARVWTIRSEAVAGRETLLGATAVVLRGHQTSVEPGAWSPDGLRVATASGDRTARVWHPGQGGAELIFAEHEGPVVEVAWSSRWSGGEGTGDSGTSSGCLRTVSADGTRRLRPTGLGAAGCPARVAKLAQPPPNSSGSVPAWSPDGRRALAAAGATVLLWQGVERQTVLDPADARRLDGHQRPVHALAWRADGRYAVSAGEDGRAIVRDAGGARVAVVEVGEAHPIWSVAWSPDGTFLLTGQADSRILAWRVVSDRQARIVGVDSPPTVLEGHNLLVRRIVFGPGGRRFASLAMEERVLLWDLEAVRRARRQQEGSAGARSVRPMNVLEGHEDWVESVAWSPDGRYLATGSLDGTARVWHLELDELRDLLRSATRVCLDTGFREEVLGEPAAEAESRWQACERAQGREP